MTKNDKQNWKPQQIEGIKELLFELLTNKVPDIENLSKAVADADKTPAKNKPGKINKLELLLLILNTHYTSEQMAKYWGVSAQAVKNMCMKFGLNQDDMVMQAKGLFLRAMTVPKKAVLEGQISLLTECENSIRLNRKQWTKLTDDETGLLKDEYMESESSKSYLAIWLTCQKEHRMLLDSAAKLRSKAFEFFSQELFLQWCYDMIEKFGGKEARNAAIEYSKSYVDPYAIMSPTLPAQLEGGKK